MRASPIVISVLLATAFLVAPAGAGSAPAGAGRSGDHPHVWTDGHLRVGHLETIHVSGFPGRGIVSVSVFPTAICESSCTGAPLGNGRTDPSGAATLRARVPGTFIDYRERRAYFRDRERVDIEASWEGPDKSFDHASSRGEPIIVRVHGGSHG